MADVVERGEIKEVELKIAVQRNGAGLEVDEDGNAKKIEKMELPECGGGKQPTRFANRRWEVWWRRHQCERYLEIGCIEGRGDFMEARKNLEVEMAFLTLKNLKTKGAYYMIQRWKIPQETLFQRFVRLRYEELRTFEKFSLDWSFPKWCHKDKDLPEVVEYYNSRDYFERRKKQTKSPIALGGNYKRSAWAASKEGVWYKYGETWRLFTDDRFVRFPLRCFPMPIVKSSSMPYSVEDKDGKPAAGDKQTWVHDGYKKVSENIILKARRGPPSENCLIN